MVKYDNNKLYSLTKTNAQTNGLLAMAQRTRPINLSTSLVQQVEGTCIYIYVCMDLVMVG